MRKLNEFYRALSKFANAVVVIDHMVEAVAFFAKAQANKPKQTDLPEEGQGG